MTPRITLIGLGLATILAGPATGQTVPIDLSSTSFTQSFQADPAPAVRVDGLLGSQASPFVSLFVPDTIGSPGGQAAVAQVGAALTAGAAPVRVRLSEPRFVGTTPTQRIINGTPTPVVIDGFNSGTTPLAIPTGARGVCATPGVAGFLGDGGELPAGCQNNTTTDVPVNSAFILTNTNTPQLVLVGSADVYAVTATPITQIGTGHALARVAVFQSLDRLADRVLGEIGDPSFFETGDRPWTVFAEAYGGFGHINSDPGRFVPGARTEFGGVTGGFGGNPWPGVMLGWVFDVSRVDMTTNDAFAPESSRVDMVKTGPFGSFRLGDFTLAFLAIAGRGDVGTDSGSAAAGGVASAGYGLNTQSGGGEVSFDLRRLIGVSIAPQFGYQYARVETDGFTESGSPFALRGRSNAVQRQRAWLGAVWRESYDVGPLRADVRAYGRLINLWGDTDGDTDALFLAVPGAGQVNLSGPQLDGVAAQWGIRVRVPFLVGVAQASYDGQTGAGFDSHLFAFRARFSF